MPSHTTAKLDTELSHRIAEAHAQLNAVRAKCPECGRRLIADFITFSGDGIVYQFSCDNPREDGEFYVIATKEGGQWRIDECGYGEGEAESEPCEVVMEDDKD